MQYDAQGRLTSAEKQPAAATYAMTRVSYGYDGSGNIVSTKVFSDAAKTGAYTLTEDDVLEYNADRVPVKVTQTSGTDQAVEQYTYTNGNIVALSRKGNTGINKFETNLNALTYDTKPNPFYGLVTAGPDRLLYSKNNLLEGTLTYDANGMLSKKVVTRFGVTITETYTYESY
jgi:YD repeat-containing protein